MVNMAGILQPVKNVGTGVGLGQISFPALFTIYTGGNALSLKKPGAFSM